MTTTDHATLLWRALFPDLGTGAVPPVAFVQGCRATARAIETEIDAVRFRSEANGGSEVYQVALALGTAAGIAARYRQ